MLKSNMKYDDSTVLLWCHIYNECYVHFNKEHLIESLNIPKMSNWNMLRCYILLAYTHRHTHRYTGAHRHTQSRVELNWEMQRATLLCANFPTNAAPHHQLLGIIFKHIKQKHISQNWLLPACLPVYVYVFHSCMPCLSLIFWNHKSRSDCLHSISNVCALYYFRVIHSPQKKRRKDSS